MPAAKTTKELFAVTQKEFDKLHKLIAKLDEAVALAKDETGTSIKDVIAHRAHWIELFFGWYADGLAGKPVFFPAEGYKWSDLKGYNADLRAQQADMGWPQAVAALEASHRKLLVFIGSHSDAYLYAGPMKGANNAWTPGRWAEAAGPSHYRSAAKHIRLVLRQR